MSTLKEEERLTLAGASGPAVERPGRSVTPISHWQTGRRLRTMNILASNILRSLEDCGATTLATDKSRPEQANVDRQYYRPLRGNEVLAICACSSSGTLSPSTTLPSASLLPTISFSTPRKRWLPTLLGLAPAQPQQAMTCGRCQKPVINARGLKVGTQNFPTEGLGAPLAPIARSRCCRISGPLTSLPSRFKFPRPTARW
ncbi:hypothetical protein F4821DRAFT_18361 [Hypoxylon rubiginosum]|uniref:Uncharacterized protein n=1 Tax=Hypoxylon rubiginosum TaxID=110542 RepID=A0ACC0CMX6_9PEZI|nr:hypothetical protein F4821DRAFT_18361 [Hypoxylon rubiginosum]